MGYFDDASLVMIPSGYKDGKLYSVKPSDGAGDFTFSRGSNLAATRVNEDGLIEKGRENLILQSNQFDTTWTLSGATITGGQSGYDGSSDAWELDSSGAGSYINQVKSISGVHTFSTYIKAGTTDYVLMLTLGAGNAFFNLNGSGAVGTNSGLINANIESIGGGWFRCSITQNASASSFRLYPASSGGTQEGSIYIQDAQLEVGLVATDYIETTTTSVSAGILEDMPRLDYSGGASCPALLLEPQRSNLVTYSEYISTSGWDLTNTNATITNNATTSPEGKVNGVSLVADGSSALHYMNESVYTATSGVAYTYSLFAKSNGSDYIQIATSTGFLSSYQNYNLATGALASGDAVAKGYSVDIEDYGNGWYRLIFTATTTSTSARFLIIPIITDTTRNPVFTGDGNGVYIYGIQREQASYPTSYIPTYGTAVTRGVDSCSKTGASGLIGQSEGTIYWEVEPNNSGSYARFSLSDGTTVNWIFAGIEPNGAARGYVRSLGTTSADIFGSTDLTNTKAKIALAYKTNDVVLYVNGSQIGTDTSATIPACSRIDVANPTPTNAVSASTTNSQVLLFKTRLTNDELVVLTRLYDTYQELVDGEGLIWESKSCTVQSIVELQNL